MKKNIYLGFHTTKMVNFELFLWKYSFERVLTKDIPLKDF